MTAGLRESICLQVARKVRAITNRPMTIVPAPKDPCGRQRAKDFSRFRETGDAEKIAGYFFSASDILGRKSTRTSPVNRRRPYAVHCRPRRLALDAPRVSSRKSPSPEGRMNPPVHECHLWRTHAAQHTAPYLGRTARFTIPACAKAQSINLPIPFRMRNLSCREGAARPMARRDDQLLPELFHRIAARSDCKGRYRHGPR